jgi:hypothetical protein
MWHYCGCLFPTKICNTNKMEQMAVPSEFRLFQGREKPSEFCSEPFLWRTNPRNSVPNHFFKEKNPRNSISNHFWMIKTSKFRSKPFSEEKKPPISVPNHFRKRKNFRIPFWIIFGREKFQKKTTFVSCFIKLHYFAEFHSVLFHSELQNGLFQNTRNHTEWALYSPE